MNDRLIDGYKLIMALCHFCCLYCFICHLINVNTLSQLNQQNQFSNHEEPFSNDMHILSK